MKLNLVGYAGGMGYAVATLNILKALIDEGVEVSFFPIKNYKDSEPQFQKSIEIAMANSIHCDESAPTLQIAEQSNMHDWPGTGRRFALSFFELDQFTEDERNSLNNADVIFAPSKWAQSIVNADSILSAKPTHVTPMGVDRSIFKSKAELIPRFGVTDAVTTFINVGKLEIRKGHDFLLTAINKAFTPADPIQVIMVGHNPFIGDGNRTWREAYRQTRMGSCFVFPSRVSNQEKLAILLSKADAGFFPYRAEGWNLDLLECLSVGLPVIATNYSAPTEYLSGDNARLIDIDELEDAKDGVFFPGGRGNWAKFGQRQLDQAVAHLREIHRRKQLGRQLDNKPGIDTAEKFSWRNTAKEIIKGLQL